MSLLVWLPLISNTKNQGIANPTITTTGTIAYNAGKIGNALTFNNSALTLKPAPLDTNTKEFSFAFWYKPTNGTSYQCLYNGRTAVGSAIAIFRDPSNLWRFDDGTQRTFNYGPTLNEWHHYVFTRDESNVKLYKDGVLQQTMTASSFTCATASASIGMSSVSNATPNANAIIGQLNDYRIYDHVLSMKEIKELAKGLTIHMPMSWGANANMIKNSYTWMNKSGGSVNQWTNSGLTYAGTILEDNNAPCHWVYKRTITNSKESNVGGAGMFYGIGTQGLALTDLTEGETYTYSFWAKSDSGVPSGLGAAAICESQTHVSNTGFGALDSNWRKHTVTFKWTKTTKLTACFYVTVPASSTIDFQVCGFKLETGAVATPYIPHVEEAAYTGKGYANKFKENLSGFAKTTTILSAPINGGDSIKNDSCTYFDGTDDGIQIDETALPTMISDKFTMSFWIKPDGESGARSVYFGSNGNTAYTLNIEKNVSNQLRFYWNGNPDYSNTAFTIADDVWQHIAIVRESATSTKFYKNGTLINTYTTSCAAQTSGASNYYLARDQRTGATCYKGYMSDFRLYVSALTADDIKELYQIPAQIDKSGKMYCGSLVEV